MKTFFADFSVKLLYLILGGMIGFFTSFHTIESKIEYARLQYQIDNLKKKTAYVCEAKGSRMECLSYVLDDKGI